MTALVIYHDNCEDGFAAAFAAWLHLGDSAEYVAVGYEDRAGWEKRLADLCPKAHGNAVYVLDLAAPDYFIRGLYESAEKLVWLDHHKDSFVSWLGEDSDWYEESGSGLHVLLDKAKSGAILSWEYFHPGKDLPQVFRHIDDYDRWVFRLENTKEFIAALQSYAPWDFSRWQVDYLYQNTIEDQAAYEEVLNEGAAILRHRDAIILSILKQATPCEIAGVKGLIANCPHDFRNEVGDALAAQSGSFGLTWFVKANGQCKCSIRSKNSDVTVIANSFGGSGHETAAGFEVSLETLQAWCR